MFILYLIIAALLIWVEWYIAEQFYEAAEAKGYHSRKYFWLCFLFSFAGYFLVVALPDRGNKIPVISDELPEI